MPGADWKRPDPTDQHFRWRAAQAVREGKCPARAVDYYPDNRDSRKPTYIDYTCRGHLTKVGDPVPFRSWPLRDQWFQCDTCGAYWSYTASESGPYAELDYISPSRSTEELFTYYIRRLEEAYKGPDAENDRDW